MKNIDAIIMEQLGDSTFFKEQLEKNISDEKILSFLKSHLEMRSEQIIQKKIIAFVDKNLERLISEEFSRLLPTINLEEMVTYNAEYLLNKSRVDSLVEEIMEDDFYDKAKELFEDYFIKILTKKLSLD